MKSFKIISSALFVFMLVLIPVLAQQSGRSQSGQTGQSGQMGQTQSGQMGQDQTMSRAGMDNLVGANVYASDQKTKLGTITDIQNVNGQNYFLIMGSDNNIHPVPVGVISAIDLNLKDTEFKDSPSFSVNQQQPGTTWAAKADSYYQKYEVQRPVSQNIPSGSTGSQTTPQGGTR